MDLKQAYQEAGSIQELARRLDRPYSSVRTSLIRAGIPIRSAGYHSPRRVSISRGPGHHNWKGGRLIKGGYVLIYAPDHPDAGKYKGYIPEHRLVAEQTLGRRLQPSETAHHLNGNPTDNRPENIVVMTRSAHVRSHKEQAPRDTTGHFTLHPHDHS